MARLSGRVALVTGGSRGIGAAIARRFGLEGAAVAITCSSSKREADQVVQAIEQAGGRALAIQADSADVAAVKAAIATTVERFGPIDILVNNAAIFRNGIVDDYSLDDFDQMFAVNVKAPFVAIQETLKTMGPGGRIINIGSVSSDHMPIPGFSVYAATKGALTSMTRALARDLGPRGITINNVQPGRVDTRMMPADGAIAEKIRGGIAVQRFGSSDEVAGLVAYLASAEAAFVTGQSMKVDGGSSA